MTLTLFCGWDTTEIGTFAGVLSGAGSGTATVAASKYSHTSLTAITTLGSYAAFASAVQTALNAVTSGFTVSFSTSTLAYTITHNAAEFTLTWTGSAGTNLKRALGFSASSSTSTNRVLTSAVRPYYLIVPQIAGRSNFTDVYEESELVDEAVADDGTPFGIAKERSINPTDTVPIRYCDWQHTMETKAATLARSATSSVPWTWEHFFMHARTTHPFSVEETGMSTVLYALRADGASFTDRQVRSRVVSDYDGLWNIGLRTRDLGVLS